MSATSRPLPLAVPRGRGFGGRFRPPGDKSITHRAYLLGALAEGTSEVENPNPGEDCAATLRCVRALGAEVTTRGSITILTGMAMRPIEPDDVLDCGNSGTTLRLLAGPLAAQPFLSVLTGDDSLRRRPVDRVIEPLRLMGARLEGRGQGRFPPLVVQGGALRAIDYQVPVASAQIASCVLLAGLFAAGGTSVTLPLAARDHTERMLGGFGVEVERTAGAGESTRSRVRGRALPRATRVQVPGDFSAAAFFLALAAATPGSQVTAEGVSLNPTRTALLEVLELMGVEIDRRGERLCAGEPVGDVCVRGPDRLRAADVPASWVPRMVDEIPAWAIVAARAEGVSRLEGAAELRVKESDRLAALAENLRALGLEVEEAPDGLTIRGGEIRGGAARSHGDHRIAMACSALGTLAREPVVVDDARSIATSYPDFAETLSRLCNPRSTE